MSQFDLKRPIAALASGRENAGIAVIRMCGENCHSLLKKAFQPKSKKAWEPNSLKWGYFKNLNGTTIDEPMAVYFNAPFSYTGEDACEIHCHGSPFIISEILRTLYEIGFYQADPGEFTRRAFLNGKMDLTTSEGINELIKASSYQQWYAAQKLVGGELKNRIEELRQNLLEALALLEAQIDFPDEEETSSLHLGLVKEKIGKVEHGIHKLIESFNSGRVTTQGLRVALIGPPNAGKSTLLNTLLGSERAIVTDQPGTTRDFIEEAYLINGRLIKLIDTAGIRKSKDSIEQIGIERSMLKAQEADLILCLVPKDQLKFKSDWLDKLPNQKQRVVILTKNDLPGADSDIHLDHSLAISCKTASGMDELKRILVEQVDKHFLEIKDQPFLSSERQLYALEKSFVSLTEFHTQLKLGTGEEVLAFILSEAQKYLAEVIGAIHTDDILDEIFSRFCLGK